ncbi:unnamed protein product (macronuclear) [Paramecium tetraurelia]|uniref:RNA helicase n=1 Tax=Paramecium tetraurelia TaxID=5888 RepID=A0CA40_PARTE|nr:uncharacterized protein GSPATT00036436001 [Paramecium tetraurelia]CAK67657.1 unnamed protein product [Paramecium tetraurelia]|eukprot:XP_001435054.1 hypothetical protein (macronuclear) [Paramecium tetraurelia strain d4-2]
MNWNQFEAIHQEVIQNLENNGFATPTPVQVEVLNNYQKHKHIIIASQTGSGKTLAFGIPLISEILKNMDKYPAKQIIALILTPTRELAMQIYKHLKAITNLSIGCLVGGMSKEKQKRIINAAPVILIATPGRLWDFIENEENDKIKNLNLIKFLIIDEADRMVELGHFPQLDNIMTKITTPSQITHDKDRILSMMNEQSEAAYLNNQKITFEVEKPVEMSYEDFIKLQNGKGKIYIDNDVIQNDIEEINKDDEVEQEGQEEQEVEEEEEQEQEDDVEEEEDEEEGEEGEEEDGEEGEDEEQNEEDIQEEENEDEDDEQIQEDEDENDEVEENQQGKRKAKKEQKQKQKKKPQNFQQQEYTLKTRNELRTFLVSATLTHQFKTGSKFQFLKTSKNDQQNSADKLLMKQMKATVPKLQSLLGKLKVKEQPYIIDLTQQLVFPEKLQFYKSLMEEDDKLLHIYHWFKNNEDQTFIIFLNSITYANKVTSMLKVLGLPAVTLHSQQQQRQRLTKLDQFTAKKSNIMVCTDVAARGLDIVGVENVIHYQVPFTADTFVHRCGRTARINREGKTLVLIGPKDMARFAKLESDLLSSGIKFEDFKLSFNQVKKTRDMIKQAQRLEKEDHSLKKKKNMKDALQKQLKNDDFDLDEKELKQELENIEEELIQKRKKLDHEKMQYQQIVSQKNKLDGRFDRRRNGLFLTPEDTLQLAERLKHQKEMLQQKQQYQKNKKG